MRCRGAGVVRLCEEERRVVAVRGRDGEDEEGGCARWRLLAGARAVVGLAERHLAGCRCGAWSIEARSIRWERVELLVVVLLRRHLVMPMFSRVLVTW